MDWQETPVFITNFNNLDRGFRKLVDWLRAAGMTRIGVVDNASTWPPLLEYYKTSDLQIVHAGSNLGHHAFWELGLHAKMDIPFIVTDPDLVPDPCCPKDLVRKIHEVSSRHYGGAKVGPSLRIDNLPDHYACKGRVIDWEKRYWVDKEDGDCFHSPIDGTFAMYQPGWGLWPDARHLRLDFPYVMRHEPWYEDSAHLSEEKLYYDAHVKPGICNW